jgi:hypothetical protein
MRSLLLPLVLLCAGFPTASAQSPRPLHFSELGLPASLDRSRLQGLLQRFVDQGYGKAFHRVGDEDDFDHGHLLLNAKTHEPVAILYHTQELTAGTEGLDAKARNWIQWLDHEGIEDAARYQRRDYPSSPSWDWFVFKDLPALQKRHTIIDKMLDPALLGTELGKSVQWVFTRVGCDGSAAAADSSVIGIVLPTQGQVCLALSAS